MPCWLSILQGLSIPILGLITTWVAVWQLLDNRFKTRMEHYERRLKIYQETVKFLSYVVQDLNPELREMFGFNASTAEAGFLFPPEIKDYLREIYRHAVHLYTANKQHRDQTQAPLPENIRMEVVEKMDKETGWFLEQHEHAEQLFMPHLKLWR